MLTIGGGAVVAADGIVTDGHVAVAGGRIVSVGAGAGADRWTSTPVVAGSPGFIDVQINGAHGIDVTTQPERIDELGDVLVRYGVTAFVPTVITCPPAAGGGRHGPSAR